MTSRTARTSLAVLLTAVGASCAGPVKLPTPKDAALSVQLPVVRAGVSDERAGFAAVFEAQLRSLAWPSSRQARDWLTGVPATVATVSPAATAATAAEIRSRVAAVEHRFAERAGHTAVLLVPGLFGDCVASQSLPFGDGQVRDAQANRTQAYGIYADLGLHSIGLADLPGRASAAANGQRLAEQIRVMAARPGVSRLVVIGYSKGVTDLLHALHTLESGRSMPQALTAVVSVSGIVMGTPLADRYGSAYESLAANFDPLECSGSQGGEVESLRTDVRREWLAQHPLPASVKAYSVVVRADDQSIAAALAPLHRQLAQIDDRNDGQVIVADSILPGSTVLAEALADHWSVALPMERHPSAWRRSLASPRVFPREALLRAVLKVVVADSAAPRK